MTVATFEKHIRLSHQNLQRKITVRKKLTNFRENSQDSVLVLLRFSLYIQKEIRDSLKLYEEINLELEFSGKYCESSKH